MPTTNEPAGPSADECGSHCLCCGVLRDDLDVLYGDPLANWQVWVDHSHWPGHRHS